MISPFARVFLAFALAANWIGGDLRAAPAGPQQAAGLRYRTEPILPMALRYRKEIVERIKAPVQRLDTLQPTQTYVLSPDFVVWHDEAKTLTPAARDPLTWLMSLQL